MSEMLEMLRSHYFLELRTKDIEESFIVSDTDLKHIWIFPDILHIFVNIIINTSVSEQRVVTFA